MSDSAESLMTAQAGVDDMTLALLDRRSPPYNHFRRALRYTLHFLSYHFVLTRSRTRISRAAGFRLTVPPTVFHPGYFITSRVFAKFINRLDLSGTTVVDVGTGSGILALAAARAGAQTVIALDINPNASAAAAENAEANGFGGRVQGVCSNLLSATAPKPLFDVIISNPPSFAGEPRDVADAAWVAGSGNKNILSLFDQARERLKPGGRIYLLLSSHSDLRLYGKAIADAGFKAKLALENSILFESFLLYELTP